MRKVDYRSDGKHKRRSTYIVTHTNADFLEYGNGAVAKVRFKVYEKDLMIFTEPNVSEQYKYEKYPSGAIAEIVATNKDGLIYVYGLPVYERNEKNIQFSMNSSDLNFNGNVSFSEEGMVAMVKPGFKDADAKRKLGQSDPNSYPTTYLLTQILTPDYVDRTGDGPTVDDFGNFTQIQYQRIHGGAAKWYSHRSPYVGVNFSEGSLSSSSDDMGSFSSGQKEVYLVRKILSKTHVADFNTSPRLDGISANFDRNSSDEEIMVNGINLNKGVQLNKLDKIV